MMKRMILNGIEWKIGLISSILWQLSTWLSIKISHHSLKNESNWYAFISKINIIIIATYEIRESGSLNPHYTSQNLLISKKKARNYTKITFTSNQRFWNTKYREHSHVCLLRRKMRSLTIRNILRRGENGAHKIYPSLLI